MMEKFPNRFTVLCFTFITILLGFIVAIAIGRESPHKSSIPQTETPNPLQFKSNSSFKIALFADLHYGENAWTDWGPRQDANSNRVMSTVLDLETPGDLVTANNLPIANASLYWDMAINPTRARGIPWASLFGNHDDMPFEWPIDWFSASGIPQLRCPPPSTYLSSGEEECSFRGTQRMELMNNEMQKNDGSSYSRSGPKDLWPSVSNYVLQVSSSNDPKSPVAFLYFLDSGGGSYPEIISNAQVKWFQNTSQKLNPQSRLPEIIFWHIPSQAYKQVAPKSRIQQPCVGSINLEAVAPQESEMGMMDFIANRTSVKAVFVGHNHGLDWCCPYNKLWLCFARHTGYGGYGNWPRGARILEMTQQPFSLKSWIRMEDGIKHSEVVLSS
ncbi:probable inactive purple acid phosphatase 16 isoform X2 [Macadamia integrifolia]|uniref:probable inactive purple acid phosphatase 16 isoform X2 n=1 Tax=Macadamia integrifolia TaxID=60698 RepID=UPI001C529C41|nr:probable inactive purple acid phosphatase 16 isoform X2 [Macadamia integrifolia]